MYDLAVIGLGPAGIEAVKTALNNNLKVIAFNKGYLGGTCLNVGCIPTKAILHSAIGINSLSRFKEIGINLNSCEYKLDWNKIIERKNSIVSKFSRSLELYLKNSENLTYINSEAEIVIEDENVSIQADYNMYNAKNVIIATGSKPFNIPNLEFDGKFIISSDDLFNLDELPDSVAILGSGAVGSEWAYILSSFGVKVFLIEKENAILPNLDVDIQKNAEKILKQQGVKIFKSDGIEFYLDNFIKLNSGNEFKADLILSCAGRVPILPDIILAGYDGKFDLKVDYMGNTDFDNIFVAGDASRGAMLAHKASYQARNIVNKIVNNVEFTIPDVPSVVYLNPEIASIGLREQDIDDTYTVKKVNLVALQKAWCDDSTLGMLKIIIKDDLIKGVHIVSNEASSLLPVFQFIIDNNISQDKVKNMMLPHPSYSELILEVLSR